MKCPKCGSENPDWGDKCASCGADLMSTLPRLCVSCGRQIGFSMNVCPYCGHDYRIPAVPPIRPETISTGMKIALYVLSFFIPIAGIVIGIIYLTKPEAELKHVGKMCIILAVLPILITVALAAILYIMVLGFGGEAINTLVAPFFD